MDRFLFECKEEFQSLMNSAPHLITSINNEGIIMTCNNKIFEVLGYNKEEILGISILDLIHPDHHYKAMESWKGLISKGFFNKERFRMICKDGHEIEVQVSSTGIKEENQKNYTKIWVIENLNKQLELGELNMNSNNGNGARADVYLDILSHDIKQLTQAIATYSELLLMKPDLPEQYSKYFLTTMLHSRTICDLINNVKLLSYVKNNVLELMELDIFKVLAEAIDRVQQSNPYKSLKINQSISESDVLVLGNDLLEEVFTNIINNAIRYEKHENVSIEISHSLVDHDGETFWKLEFKDNGPGIPDEYKERIFHDFEIGNGYKHGSGLGLALVKEIITKSGGKVWVEDRVKNDFSLGSNFVLLLPKAE